MFRLLFNAPATLQPLELLKQFLNGVGVFPINLEFSQC